MGITWGTSHFVSIEDAYRYYGTPAYKFTRKDVDRKLAEGEISIGPPSLKDGEILKTNSEGRYTITSTRREAEVNNTTRTGPDGSFPALS